MTTRTKLTSLVLACVAVAGLLGASAGGTGPAAAPAPRAAGQLESDWVRGAFWRPAGSVATRPALRLARATWTPGAAPASSDTLASLRAVVRLAASD